MSQDYIYTKHVQYNKKGKWRNCILQIEIVHRCQDKLMAILNGVNDKIWIYKFPIFGYECNNDLVGLIGNNGIHRIKFESLDMVLILIELLSKYMKDVFYKLMLSECSANQEALLVNEWYTIHVQTNRICFTTEDGNQLITKWRRSDIRRCYIQNSFLNIEIVFKNEIVLYSFFRDERFPLEKILKAIQNLKFELPLYKSEKLPSTPRRSESIDSRRVSTWGNTKERIARERTSHSFRTCDLYSNDGVESSSPSAPCSPAYQSLSREMILGSKDYKHIDETSEEMDELIFPFDTQDVQAMTSDNVYKAHDYTDAKDILTTVNDSNIHKLVDLERCPFESERKIQGKRSPETISPPPVCRTPPNIHIYSHNVHEYSRNGSCYQTMSSIEHNRKASSASNFLQSPSEELTARSLSHSADASCTHTGTGTTSQRSSPLALALSSSTSSSRTPASLKQKDRQLSTSNEANLDPYQLRMISRRPSLSDSNHNYYNLRNPPDDADIALRRPLSSNDEYSFQCPVASTGRYYNVSSEDRIHPNNAVVLHYSHIYFPTNSGPNVSKKRSPQLNYQVIDHQKTEALREVDDNIALNGYVIHRKKKTIIRKIFKK